MAIRDLEFVNLAFVIDEAATIHDVSVQLQETASFSTSHRGRELLKNRPMSLLPFGFYVLPLTNPMGGRTPASVMHIVHAEVKQHPMKIQPYHGDSVLSVSTVKASGRTFRYKIFDLGGSSMYRGPLPEVLPADVCLLMVHPHEEREN